MKYYVLSKFMIIVHTTKLRGALTAVWCVTNGPQTIGWEHCLLNASNRLMVHIAFIAVSYLGAHTSRDTDF